MPPQNTNTQTQKVLDERREEARRALEGEDRRKREDAEALRKKEELARIEAERKAKAEAEKRHIEEEARKKTEAERARQVEEEAKKRTAEREASLAQEKAAWTKRTAVQNPTPPSGATAPSEPVVNTPHAGSHVGPVPRPPRLPNSVALPPTPSQGVDTREEHQHTRISTTKTFENDIARTIREEKQSVAQMAVLGNEHRRKAAAAPRPPIAPQNKQHEHSHALLVFTIITVIVLGFGCVWYAFSSGIFHWGSQSDTATTNTQASSTTPFAATPAKVFTFTSLIPVDDQIPVDVTNKSAANAREALTQAIASVKQGATDIVPYTTEDGTTHKLSAADFLDIWAQNIPPFLVRALSDNYIFGIEYTAAAHPFMIFKTSSFDRSYGGMLSWENTMPQDLASIMPALPQAEPPYMFTDDTVMGSDVRTLRSTSGTDTVSYLVPEKGVLVITDTEDTMRMILAKLK